MLPYEMKYIATDYGVLGFVVSSVDGDNAYGMIIDFNNKLDARFKSKSIKNDLYDTYQEALEDC